MTTAFEKPILISYCGKLVSIVPRLEQYSMKKRLCIRYDSLGEDGRNCGTWGILTTNLPDHRLEDPATLDNLGGEFFVKNYSENTWVNSLCRTYLDITNKARGFVPVTPSHRFIDTGKYTVQGYVNIPIWRIDPIYLNSGKLV